MKFVKGQSEAKLHKYLSSCRSEYTFEMDLQYQVHQIIELSGFSGCFLCSYAGSLSLGFIIFCFYLNLYWVWDPMDHP